MPASSNTHSHPSNPALYVLLALAIGLVVWSFWIGTVIARLWYWKGQLQGEYEKFDIQPEYIRRRLAREKANGRDTMMPILEPQRAVRTMDEDEHVTDPVLRARIREEKRISHLPVFIQDDGGDGSDFPNVRLGVPVEEYNAALYPRLNTDYRKLGLHRMKDNEWLTVDGTYEEFMDARATLLARKHDECIQMTPDGEASCMELLWEVVDFLTHEYPSQFSVLLRGGVRKVRNHILGEDWSLQEPYDCPPLEVCARLCMEDFNVLLQSHFTGQYVLAASATCFPTGWRLLRQIGTSVTNLREPVLSWDNFSEILSYLEQVPDPPMKRTSTFIQTMPGGYDVLQLLFIQQRHDLFPGKIGNLAPSSLMVRRERHSFRRLSKSGAIVFTVRTQVQSLVDLSQAGRQALANEIREWSATMAGLKGKDLWQRSVLGFCEGKGAAYDDMSVVDPRT